MRNIKTPIVSVWLYINGWFLSIIMAFVLAGVVSTYSTPFTSDTIKPLIKDLDAGELFINLLRSENHYFYTAGEDTDIYTFSDLALKLATNIQPTDTRTFLGSELPGFSIFDTEIVVAGEGTDFTTLPIESAPPMDVLLKEREIANEMLKEEEDESSPPMVTGKKSVFIYHTHSSEAFIPLLKGVTKANEAFSTNEKVNVVAVGKRLATELNKHGIGVELDTTNMTEELQKKSWTYGKSYSASRSIVQEAMATNEDLDFLIDIHRDGQRKDITTKMINGKPFARLFFIVGEENKNYEQNLKIASELEVMLEQRYPGISRGVFVKGKSEGNGVYNQDLSTRALLVEFGGVDNDLTELYNTVEVFAEIFSEYYRKAEMVNG
ncbi:stage II sporulation protein P [Cytobacillus sp. FJAT-54145]|uniref:Stage II sporulation protein P n=1 Tax=Cytobacillus spartinae TaxID=3299023 RepID=A0ABW6KHW7_9BACI